MLRFLKILNAWKGVDHLLFSQVFVYYYTNVVPAVILEIQEDGIMFIESVTSNDEVEIIHKVNVKMQDSVQMSLLALWQ